MRALSCSPDCPPAAAEVYTVSVHGWPGVCPGWPMTGTASESQPAQLAFVAPRPHACPPEIAGYAQAIAFVWPDGVAGTVATARVPLVTCTSASEAPFAMPCGSMF
jgi:hypothetical protein